MRRILVWDLPVRVFHWTLAASFTAAFLLAVVVDDEHPLFAWHALLGLFITLLAVARIAWGVIGSRHARFRRLALAPGALWGYLRGVVTGRDWPQAGHNPAAAWGMVVMLGLLIGLAATGVLSARGYEAVGDVHEGLAYAMVAVVGVHIAGVALHTLRHRDGLPLSMVHGRKRGDPAEAIASPRRVSALVVVVLLALWGAGLIRGYDPAAGTVRLPLLGATLALSESESAEAVGLDADGKDDDDD